MLGHYLAPLPGKGLGLNLEPKPAKDCRLVLHPRDKPKLSKPSKDLNSMFFIASAACFLRSSFSLCRSTGGFTVPLLVLPKGGPISGAAELGSILSGTSPCTSRNGELSRDETLECGAEADGPKMASSGAMALAARNCDPEPGLLRSIICRSRSSS